MRTPRCRQAFRKARKRAPVVPGGEHRGAEIVGREVVAGRVEISRQTDELRLALKENRPLPLGQRRVDVRLGRRPVAHAGVHVAALVKLAQQFLQNDDFGFPLHVSSSNEKRPTRTGINRSRNGAPGPARLPGGDR